MDLDGRSLSCTTRTCSGINGCIATCPSGYVATGGGPLIAVGGVDSQSDYPSGNGWTCWWGYNRVNTCYAQCCRIQ